MDDFIVHFFQVHPKLNVFFFRTRFLVRSRWSPSLRVAGDTGPLSDFIEGLGPGQLVGRQVLGAPALGDIQLSMCYQKGSLEVEVIRARGLQVGALFDGGGLL